MPTLTLERGIPAPAQRRVSVGDGATSVGGKRSSVAMPRAAADTETTRKRLVRVADEVDEGKAWLATGMDRTELHKRLFGR